MTSDEAINILIDVLGYAGMLFDMIFIDGEHFYEYARNDIQNYLPLLEIGGLFCGHDYTPDAPEFGGVIRAVHELVPDGMRVNIPVGRIWEYTC